MATTFFGVTAPAYSFETFCTASSVLCVISGVFGPNRISNSIAAVSDFFTFSELVYQAQYETPSIFSSRSENDVGRAGGVNVGVGVADGDGLGEGVADGEGEGDGVALGEGLAAGAALTTTPLFHTNFFPCLIQVYLRPLSTV
jgi:hypothetical protein